MLCSFCLALILINADRTSQNLPADCNGKVFPGTVGPFNQGKTVFLDFDSRYAPGMNAAAGVKERCLRYISQHRAVGMAGNQDVAFILCPGT